MARITDEAVLMDRVIKMLPKGIPSTAIHSVECDPTDGCNGGPSYWVYLQDGYISPEMGCHTIHEDTLKELRDVVRGIEEWPDDPALEQHNGYTKYEEPAEENKRYEVRESEEGKILGTYQTEEEAEAAAEEFFDKEVAYDFEITDTVEDRKTPRLGRNLSIHTCPVCGKKFRRYNMEQTHDCHGIPFRLVCGPCYDRIMEDPGYDGEYYTEADECLDYDY